MEFVLEKEVKDLVPQAVAFNFDQLKEELAKNLEKYENMVVTEDSTKEARADRAELNALRATIDDKRKEIKKLWNVPLLAFENEVKVLTGMIDKPIAAIDKQVKAYEQKVREQKEADIREVFDTTVGLLKGQITYEQIHNPKWLNVSETMAKIKKEISGTVAKIQTDIDMIKAIDSPCQAQMLEKYLVKFDMSEALAVKVNYDSQVKIMEENAKKKAEQEALKARMKEEAEQEARRKAAEFEEAARKKALKRMEAEKEAAALKERQAAERETMKQSEAPRTHNGASDRSGHVQREQISIRAWVTPDQKRALWQFMKENNIEVRAM